MPGGWMLVNDDYGCGYSDNTESEQVDGTWWGKRDIPALKQTGDELRKRNIQMGLWTQSSLDRQPAEVGDAGVRVRKLDVAWVGPGYRYALSACDTAHDGIEQYSNARGFAWMVEGWAGAQRCAVQWTGDHSGSLDAIKWQIPAITGSGNSGIAYSAGDVDGIFGGSPTQLRARPAVEGVQPGLHDDVRLGHSGVQAAVDVRRAVHGDQPQVPQAARAPAAVLLLVRRRGAPRPALR